MSAGVVPGSLIAFGTTDPTSVTNWDTIVSVQGPTSLIVLSGSLLAVASSYVILKPPSRTGLTFIDGLYSIDNLFASRNISTGSSLSLSNLITTN